MFVNSSKVLYFYNYKMFWIFTARQTFYILIYIILDSIYEHCFIFSSVTVLEVFKLIKKGYLKLEFC